MSGQAPAAGGGEPSGAAVVVRRPPGSLWREPAMSGLLAARDVGAVFRALRGHGWSQRAIGALTGQSQTEVSEIATGRRVVAYDVLVRVADGLGVPRGLMGLAYHDPSGRTRGAAEPVAECGRCRAEPAVGAWTTVEIRALRSAARMTTVEFAERLGVSGRTVDRWESGGLKVGPRPFQQSLLDTMLVRSDVETRRRFVERLWRG